MRAIDDQIKPLQDEYVALGKKRDDAVETIKQLRKDRDEVVCSFLTLQVMICSTCCMSTTIA